VKYNPQPWCAGTTGPVVREPDFRFGNITNDLLEFDPANLTWRTVDPGSGIVRSGGVRPKPTPGAPVLPAARARAAFFAAQGGLFLFAGMGAAPKALYGGVMDGEWVIAVKGGEWVGLAGRGGDFAVVRCCAVGCGEGAQEILYRKEFTDSSPSAFHRVICQR
jgi:hypothetical protein